MTSNIVKFPYDACRRLGTARKPYVRPQRKNMPSFLFRSKKTILESDEADLIRDVCRDIHNAKIKLSRVQRRLKGVKEQAAAQVQLLTAVETKLTAAIVAALLSTHGKDEA